MGKSTAAPADQKVRIEYVPLSEVRRWPKNPKKHDLDAMGASMERFGFVQPLLRDEKTGRLVAGHGRLERLVQLKESGATPPSRIQQRGGDWLVPVICGVSFRTSKEAQAYLVADNRIAERGGYDDDLLAESLRGLDSLSGTGWDASDLAALLRSEPPAAPVQAFSVEVKHTCPNCGHSWKEKRESRRAKRESRS